MLYNILWESEFTSGNVRSKICLRQSWNEIWASRLLNAMGNELNWVEINRSTLYFYSNKTRRNDDVYFRLESNPAYVSGFTKWHVCVGELTVTCATCMYAPFNGSLSVTGFVQRPPEKIIPIWYVSCMIIRSSLVASIYARGANIFNNKVLYKLFSESQLSFRNREGLIKCVNIFAGS
jgi:hypothetical protein